MTDRPIVIRVTDPETGDSEEQEMPPGEYCVTTVAPCYVDGVQVYGNGTVVLTLKNHMGKGTKRDETC